MEKEILKGLNPGIRHLVELLNEYGFRTTDSGDGKTHHFQCDRPYPYVVIQLESHDSIKARAADLVLLLDKFGIKLGTVTEALAESEIPSVPCIQVSYDPMDTLAIMDLMGVEDSMLKDSSGH